MGKGLSTIFEAMGLVLGVFMIWPDIEFIMQASGAPGGVRSLTFLEALKRGEHALLYGTLILLPAMHFLKKYLGHKLSSALIVLFFSALSVLFAKILHTALINGYVFLLAQQKAWNSIARPAAVFSIIACNWLIGFIEMYRMAKIGGRE
ncbi:MAG TPA: hypothetical protein VN604_02140 [Nitrospirota bacterium]|nr:hypothetical protein [Nitrospirota bacterium]